MWKVYIQLQNNSLFQKKNKKKQTKKVCTKIHLYSANHLNIPRLHWNFKAYLSGLTNSDKLKQMLEVKCFVETEFSDAIPTL